MDDLVKRSDALKVIETASSMVSSLLEATIELCVTMDRIAAADVVPVRRGKWEKRMNIDIMIWCSECGWMKHRGDKRNYNYCPNCGTLMDKDGDGE